MRPENGMSVLFAQGKVINSIGGSEDEQEDSCNQMRGSSTPGVLCVLKLPVTTSKSMVNRIILCVGRVA